MASKGKTFNDLVKLAELRKKAVDQVLLVLNDDPSILNWSDYKKTMLQTLARSILPRLNEHTGQDGEAIEIKGVEITIRK